MPEAEPPTRTKCPPARVSSTEYTINSAAQGKPRLVSPRPRYGFTKFTILLTFSQLNLYLAFNSRGLGLSFIVTTTVSPTKLGCPGTSRTLSHQMTISLPTWMWDRMAMAERMLEMMSCLIKTCSLQSHWSHRAAQAPLSMAKQSGSAPVAEKTWLAVDEGWVGAEDLLLKQGEA